MKIATAQYPIQFHQSFAAWDQYTEQWVKNAADQQAHILLFPEYGSMELVSLFSESVRQDIREQVRSVHALEKDFDNTFIRLAQKYEVVIIAPSVPFELHGKRINRAKVYSSKGLVGYQDKAFMTRFENEEWGIVSGTPELHVFKTAWGNFGIQICYDIEFPIGSKLLAEAGAQVIFAPSCCETLRGSTRVHVGARARALENQVYTVVAQTIGNCDWSPAVDINYGYTAVYSTPDLDFPDEGIISIRPAQQEGWLVQELDIGKLDTVRTQGSVFNYRDNQRLKISLDEQAFVVRHIEV